MHNIIDVMWYQGISHYNRLALRIDRSHGSEPEPPISGGLLLLEQSHHPTKNSYHKQQNAKPNLHMIPHLLHRFHRWFHRWFIGSSVAPRPNGHLKGETMRCFRPEFCRTRWLILENEPKVATVMLVERMEMWFLDVCFIFSRINIVSDDD